MRQLLLSGVLALVLVAAGCGDDSDASDPGTGDVAQETAGELPGEGLADPGTEVADLPFEATPEVTPESLKLSYKNRFHSGLTARL